MGLFKRKDSKNSIQTERDEQESFVSANSARTSNASLKSPGFKGSGSGLPASIPEISIAKPPDPALDPAAYLRSIHAVRERSRFVFGKAKRNKLNHFDVDMSKFEATASYIVSIIKVSELTIDKTPSHHNVMFSIWLTVLICTWREITPRTMIPFLPMVAGSTSMWVADPASISYYSPGLAQSMRKNELGD